MKFIIVNITYKGILKLVLLFQTLQLIGQRPIASIHEKNQKLFTNKSPWQHVHTTQPKGTSPCEQAQAKNTSMRQKRVGKQPLFIPNRKEQLWTQYKGTKPLRMD